MQRRRFLKAGIATCGVGLLNVEGSGADTRKSGVSVPALATTTQNWGESISIRNYLCREAARITSRAASYQDAVRWRQALPERRRQYMEMMGVDDLLPYHERPPLNVTVTGVVERPKYRIEKLYYESVPKLFVTGNLYVPKGLSSPAPAVLYVCGHAAKQKTHYQAHARRFAELGFVCLLIETLEGEETQGDHHGIYDKGCFHWISRGYTPAGVEMLNGIRGIDLLVQRSEVDPKRLGVTGISGGGSYSWWVGAGDERVKIVAPVCGTSTLISYMYDRTLDSNCDCQWWINSYRWDMADVGALIAPRPLLIVDADQDIHFTLASTRAVHQQLKRLYTLLGVPENVGRVGAAGAHGYYPLSRTAIFSWFVKHLQGKNIPPEQIGDVDERPESQESEETLRVHPNGQLPGSWVKTIQDNFIQLAEPPQIRDEEGLKKSRQSVIAGLRRKSFAAFPPTPPPLGLDIEYEFEEARGKGAIFNFASEEGWRLRGALHLAKAVTQPAPAVVGLCSPDDNSEKADWRGGAIEGFLRPIQAPWVKVSLELRGTGESVWGETLKWHVRRAGAWTGMTPASMWVYDTLRALAAVRALPQVNGRPLALAARGQMTVVALYAALLDGHVNTLFLETSPATQNAPSQPDGQSDAVEMLGCLRVTDLAQVAGLLYPAELVFIGERPSTYDWAQDIYQKLGAADRFRRVNKLDDWRPS
jgi:dienelactone hydrolase